MKEHPPEPSLRRVGFGAPFLYPNFVSGECRRRVQKTQKGAKYGKQRKHYPRHRQKCRFRSYAHPPAHARVHARVVRQTQTGIYINNIIPTNHAHACTHARDARRPFTQNEIDFWREQIFAESQEDPVKVAVEEAVKSLGSQKDFRIWAWYANRIGVNSFIDLYFEQLSIMRNCV